MEWNKIKLSSKKQVTTERCLISSDDKLLQNLSGSKYEPRSWAFLAEFQVRSLQVISITDN